MNIFEIVYHLVKRDSNANVLEASSLVLETVENTRRVNFSERHLGLLQTGNTDKSGKYYSRCSLSDCISARHLSDNSHDGVEERIKRCKCMENWTRFISV